MMPDSRLYQTSKRCNRVLPVRWCEPWDVGSGYDKAGMPPVNTTSYPKLIKSLRDAMPDKMLTLVDKDEPTASFYDPALCEGIEVGNTLITHGMVMFQRKKSANYRTVGTEHPLQRLYS